MAEEEVALRLDLKNRRETAAGLRDVDGSLGRLDRRTTVLNRGLANLGRMGRTVFKGLAVGIGIAGFAAFRLGKDALAEAREAQKIGRTTTAILKATKGAANLTRKAYDGLTNSLMRKTAIDDEQIAQAGNLLLTFKKVRREGKGLDDVFGRGLAVSLDLSAAGFGSTDSAAKMLGKALNDPLKGITALSRAGVTFTQGQQDTIKSLVEQNDLLGAQKLILKEVESQVGGTAAKQKTAGKMLETVWGNVKEEIGFQLIPVVERLSRWGLRNGIPMVRNLAGWVENSMVPALGNFASEVRPLAESLLPAAGDALGVMRDAGKKLLPIAKGIVDAFNGMPDWAKTVLVGGVGAGVLAKKTGLLSLLDSGKSGLISKATPVPVFVTNSGFGLPGTPGGKTKTPPVAALGKGLLGRSLGLASLNFLIGPEAPPRKLSDAEAGYLKLFKETGAKTQDEFFNILNSSTQDQLREWRAMLHDEFGTGFRELSQKEFTNGGSFVPKGLTAQDYRRQSNNLRDLFSVGTQYEGLLRKIPPRVETKLFAPGLMKTTTDVDRLIKKYDIDLDGREVKTLYKLLGVDQAIGDLQRLGAYLNNVEGRILEVKLNAQSVNVPSPGNNNGGNNAPDQPDKPKLPRVNGRLGPRQNTGGRGPAPTAPAGGTTLVVQTVLDGKVVAETVVEELETKMARR